MRVAVKVLTAALLASPLTAAPAPRRVKPPETRAGDFTLRVSQILRNRTAFATLVKDASEPAAASEGQVYLQIQLDVAGKAPRDALRIAGLTGDLVAVDDQGRPADFTSSLTGAGPAGASLTIGGMARSSNSKQLR